MNPHSRPVLLAVHVHLKSHAAAIFTHFLLPTETVEMQVPPTQAYS